MIESQLKVVSKAWQTLNPHLPEHVDLGPDTRKTAWSKTDSPVQARLICSANEQQAVFEVQLRVELAEMAADKKLKMSVHVEKNDAWLATHKVGNGILAPAPEVKAFPENLVEPFQIPVLVDLTAARHIQVSISRETDAAYWADIARFSFYFGSEARKSHLLWEPIPVMHERNANILADSESIAKPGGAKKLKKGIKKLLGAPPGAGLGAQHAPERHPQPDSSVSQNGSYYVEGQAHAPPPPSYFHSTGPGNLDRRESYWSEHTARDDA
ncbi:unnamed protein product [Tilletia controversa]|uniref:Uncharacterized protein n=3 Tax=Tilletia TaxID=13289 RepID=A0A8X7MWR2_9BASI|nr:hypothetical protein CF336_g2233 [Tilletia laevis]KAE8200029.1 hypothetical protein CF328_g3075 [Tilletia controversa]KAE8262574.1 hypothetical protein A4X03_0g2348 [Tilletia caries]KAE8205757.1 hypothetical protein CF335_g2192 [Tilletia laevis]KAE8252312.1 hypothetical protein A4X06_0g2281 [Tilletia controversa]